MLEEAERAKIGSGGNWNGSQGEGLAPRDDDDDDDDKISTITMYSPTMARLHRQISYFQPFIFHRIIELERTYKVI